ncbi:g11981 [Coccomyxa viridis]|uniref:G11981 protein n=1 Tax=Coccomyxa viridis TaxID=1274662 RepID=A0ABP1GEV5_9CHLO
MVASAATPLEEGVVGVSTLHVLPQLLLTSYRPETFVYTAHAARDEQKMPSLADWIEVFRASIPSFQQRAEQDPSFDSSIAKEKASAFAESYGATLGQLEANPNADVPQMGGQPISCISLCALREHCLRQQGFRDVFRDIKAEENAKALDLLPGVLRELDAIQDHSKRLELLLRGVFAGNIFDLGAATSAALFKSKGAAFEATRSSLVGRPWAVDDLDRILQQWQHKHYRKAVLFVDNAGSDVILGMLPLARELLQRGTAVVLAANSVPSINDITAPELEEAMQRAAEADPVIRRSLMEGTLTVIPSGNDLPVIDLRKVSQETVQQAGDADLIILEGMGRGIETNLYAQFSVDSLKLGMIKHREVATLLGGRLYDCVCKFDEAQH